MALAHLISSYCYVCNWCVIWSAPEDKHAFEYLVPGPEDAATAAG